MVLLSIVFTTCAYHIYLFNIEIDVYIQQEGGESTFHCGIIPQVF